jgi:hypothetical protein
VENAAGAAVAFVLGGRAVPRDPGGGYRSTRDFDIILPDGRREPLEVTTFADEAVLTTWNREGRSERAVASLRRHWSIDAPSIDRDGSKGAHPVDVRRIRRVAESALVVLEAAGYESFSFGLMLHDGSVSDAVQSLAGVGSQFGVSHDAGAGLGSLRLVIPVGGAVSGDLVAYAVESEANKEDNRAKLRGHPGSSCRHIFVSIDPSSGAAWSAIKYASESRLPNLPDPITTAWVGGFGPHLLVTTPPETWQEHAIPHEVFEHPENWIDET